MNKLTFQDYIDLEKLMAEGKNSMEQQCFLLSRYYNLPLKQIKNMDVIITSPMMKEMQVYIDKAEDTDLNKRDLNNKIREKKNKNKNKDKIKSRSEILDI